MSELSRERIERLAMDVLLQAPMSHHITAGRIVLEYHGNVYNNTLNCLTTFIERAIRKALDEVTHPTLPSGEAGGAACKNAEVKT